MDIYNFYTNSISKTQSQTHVKQVQSLIKKKRKENGVRTDRWIRYPVYLLTLFNFLLLIPIIGQNKNSRYFLLIMLISVAILWVLMKVYVSKSAKNEQLELQAYHEYSSIFYEDLKAHYNYLPDKAFNNFLLMEADHSLNDITDKIIYTGIGVIGSLLGSSLIETITNSNEVPLIDKITSSFIQMSYAYFAVLLLMMISIMLEPMINKKLLNQKELKKIIAYIV